MRQVEKVEVPDLLDQVQIAATLGSGVYDPAARAPVQGLPHRCRSGLDQLVGHVLKNWGRWSRLRDRTLLTLQGRQPDPSLLGVALEACLHYNVANSRNWGRLHGEGQGGGEEVRVFSAGPLYRGQGAVTVDPTRLQHAEYNRV